MDEAEFSGTTEDPFGREVLRRSLTTHQTTFLTNDEQLLDGPPPGLSPVSMADKPRFDAAFARLRNPISDYGFAGTFVWGSSLKLYWASIERHLCLFANGSGDLTMLLPPIPEADVSEAELTDCVEQCFEIMDRYNERHSQRERSRIEYVSDEMHERFSEAKGLSLSGTPMSGDYIYDMARMIDLAGGALKSKRHARGKFMRDFPDHRTEPLEDRHVAACLELLDVWVQAGDDSHEGEVNDAHIGTDVLRHRDRLASRVAVEMRRELGLTGMVLMVGDRMAGFTLGQALSPNQAFILLEKTHPDFPGSAQFIFSEFCRQYWSEYPECNVGDDWGIPSLRFTKQSYRPMRMLGKVVLTRQPALAVAGFSPTDVPADSSLHTHGPLLLTASEPTPSFAAAEMRAATNEDVAAILEIERECFQSLEESFNRRQVRSLIANPRATVTVAVAEGRVLGWSVGLVRQHRRTRSGRLYGIGVHLEARGKEIGRLLAEHTLAALGNLGIERVFLEVRSDNEAAIALYRQLGFQDHRFLPTYYGPGRDAQRMKHALLRQPAPLLASTETAKPAAA